MADNTEPTEPEGQEPEGQQEQKPEGTSLEGEALKAELAKTRDEAAKYRTRAKEVEKARSDLEKSYGSTAAEKQRLETELTTLKVERAVTRAARALDADEDLTLAYLTSQGVTDGLDPAKPDKVKAAVEKAIEEKASLKLTKPQRIGDNGQDLSKGAGSFNALIRRAAGAA